MERWDAYLADGIPTGETLVRGEPIPAGRYHLVAEALVRHRDGRYLLMRRDPGKDWCPGMWEASAGGSALQGEDAPAAVRREVQEETGLPITALQEIYREVGDSYLFRYYLAQTDAQTVTLQPGETVDYHWVSGAELAVLIAADQVMHARMLRAATLTL